MSTLQTRETTKKKKTILRVKRKFSDVEAIDTIILSQPSKAKRQRTVPWNELEKSFDKSFTLKPDTTSTNTESKTDNSIPNFFDYDFTQQKSKPKKQVFRLIHTRQFQPHSTNFNAKYAQNRKSKILQQRRSERQNYFEKIKKEISLENNAKNNVLQHEHFENSECNQTKAKPIKKHSLKMIQSKLLRKHKSQTRTTKIVSKKQIRQHQNELKSRRTQNEAMKGKSVFCEDWNNNNLITLQHNGDVINMQNFVGKYECFKNYLPKNMDFKSENKKGINIISVEFDEIQQRYIETRERLCASERRRDGYDYYELDEEANADMVLAAIEMRRKEKERQAMNAEMKVCESASVNETKESKLDLEWKLERIKNKYLTKHFDSEYEGPTFGYKHGNKESEEARFIEIETNDFVKDYHESVVNGYGEQREEEEIEREEEGHEGNEYPDEHQFSDEYDIEDDYYPSHNEQYCVHEQMSDENHYEDNAFDIDFFRNLPQ